MTTPRELIQEVIDTAKDPNIGGTPGHFNPAWVADRLEQALVQMSKMDELLDFIQHLHDNGAFHKKRGFSLHESTAELAANHMIEEAVELQAEATISHDRDGIVEESADVLATWLHLLIHCDVPFEEVVVRCKEKLAEAFTFNKDEILTTTPGFTRRNRQDDHEFQALFHELWTNNTGQEGYDKDKWQDLAAKVRDLTGIQLT